jgi:putative FmdB family regulatory protein
MPIYSYKCDKDHITDNIVSYKDRKKTQVCNQCGGEANFKQTFCTEFQYSENYNSFGADRHRWRVRENHRNKTVGKSYD